ncbi:hypothetical protein HOB10_01015 [Candidatus Parcubacteria bacterium]|jgi:hypothetical protein|nr:hypothetical protein [Candidatus Parcubacteria bacterium]
MGKTPVNFSGNARQCLDHYAGTLPTGKSQVLAARKPLADFCKASDPLAYRWLNGKKMPSGKNLIRLKYFLHSRGYDVAELRDLAPQVLSLGWIISIGRMSFDEACQKLGYAGRDSFFPVLNNVCNAGRAKLAMIEAILKRYPAEDFVGLNDRPILKTSQRTERSLPTSLRQSSRDAIFQALKGQVEALLPLAQAVLSDEFSDNDRRQLRRSISDDGLYNAAQALHGLCSKESRKLTLDKKGREE